MSITTESMYGCLSNSIISADRLPTRIFPLFERNTASKSIGEAIKGGAKPDGPEVAALRARSIAIGERLTEIDTELADAEAQVDDLGFQRHPIQPVGRGDDLDGAGLLYQLGLFLRGLRPGAGRSGQQCESYETAEYLVLHSGLLKLAAL